MMDICALEYEGFDPEEEELREALCTLGNGYFCTRGAGSETRDDGIHYPGTYLAGGYNRLTTQIAGEEVENEDLVNMPNWLPLTFRIEGGDWFDLQAVELLEYRQQLDLQKGILHRTIRFRDDRDRETRVVFRRLVHMSQPHYAALEMTLTSENWEGEVEVCSALDGRVINNNVERYRDLNSRHLDPLEAEPRENDEIIYLKMQTNQSEIRVAQAARTRVYVDDVAHQVDRSALKEPAYVAHEFRVRMEPHRDIRIEKVLALHTSKDVAISECGLEACKWVRKSGSFDELLRSHAIAWEDLWHQFYLDFGHEKPEEGDRIAQILHLYIFHLLQTTSINTMALGVDVGVPSRGWHGEAYRGHILWDELFIFPLINLRLPEITKAVLMYRYRRLDQARANAEEAGYRGAMYPWQSGSNGREESQRIHLNPASGRWIPDNSNLQRHVNAAIAYNLYQYYQVTNDVEFLALYGAEMILEIARFWANISTHNAELDRYEILGVVGPDEFHEGYPDRDEPGLDNNAYTNIMAVWVLKCALELLDLLPQGASRELRKSIDLREEELEQWDEISRKMRIVFHGDGIISQFEGYDQLQELDWQGYRKKYGDIQRLDRVLEAENDTPNCYKASKQADVLMLFYLFSSEELAEIFERLGYPFEYDTIPKNIRYYLQRTSHGSTLSRVVHAWVLARSDRSGSWNLFREALESDVADIQGGTTPEGIHLGAMAGTVDQLQRGYTGLVTRGDVLWLNPCLPEGLAMLRMQVRYRGHIVELEVTQEALRVTTHRTTERPIKVGFRKSVCELEAGSTREFTLQTQK